MKFKNYINLVENKQFNQNTIFIPRKIESRHEDKNRVITKQLRDKTNQVGVLKDEHFIIEGPYYLETIPPFIKKIDCTVFEIRQLSKLNFTFPEDVVIDCRTFIAEDAYNLTNLPKKLNARYFLKIIDCPNIDYIPGRLIHPGLRLEYTNQTINETPVDVDCYGAEFENCKFNTTTKTYYAYSLLFFNDCKFYKGEINSNIYVGYSDKYSQTIYSDEPEFRIFSTKYNKVTINGEIHCNGICDMRQGMVVKITNKIRCKKFYMPYLIETPDDFSPDYEIEELVVTPESSIFYYFDNSKEKVIEHFTKNNKVGKVSFI